MCRVNEIDHEFCPAYRRDEEGDLTGDEEPSEPSPEQSEHPAAVLPSVASFFPQQFIAQNSQMAFLMIKRQLMLLIHANYCQKIDSIFPDRPRCDLRHCDAFKTVLQHLRTCQAYPNCDTLRCVSSRNILSHYCSCFNVSCQICF